VSPSCAPEKPAPPGVPPAESSLAALLDAELETPVPLPVARMADAVRARHGDAARAVLFYGSCLRHRRVEGVLDFYLIVDDYRRAYRSRWLALLNRLPPNVFYVELGDGPQRLRAKYAVFSQRDFDRRAGGGPDCRIWARFAQPARLVWARDAEAAAAVTAAVVRATETAVTAMLAWLPGDVPVRRLDPATLWTRGFRETYRAELRGESEETIDSLYRAQSERFDRVALLALASRGAKLRRVGGCIEVESDPRARAQARRRWRLQRRVGKALTVIGLLKTSLTFDDWVSYVLWKIERHSGRPVEVTERQRRHPLVFGWPVIWRLLRERTLR
jgi:hypothetical protein